MKIKPKFLLIGILLVALILRFWHLGSIPPSLTPDEASLGYNAYSILKTGRDEHGKLMPIIFKSFGDYKPGLYVYLTVPLIIFFKLNEVVVRAPSALAGIAAVYLIYLIVKKLFDEKLAIVSAFALAVNPWHIMFSRGAWEVNVSLTLTLAGIYFFLKSFEDNKNLIYAAISFSLTVVCYQGAKMSVLVVLMILVLVWVKEFNKIDLNKKIMSLGIGILISIPIFLSIFHGEAGRLSVFSIFSYPRPTYDVEKFLAQNNEQIGGIDYYLFHSEAYNFLLGVLGRWFNHFSGKFLLFEGDWQNIRHSVPNQGVILLGDVVFLIIGLVVIFKKGFRKEICFVLLWLVLSPMPAALSRDAVHGVRAYNLVIPLTIIISFGVVFFLEKRKWWSYLLVLGTYLMGLAFFLEAYFIHLPVHDSKYWDYGYKQIVETVLPLRNDFKTVRIQQSYAQPYIYFLFYGSRTSDPLFQPKNYQKEDHFVESENKSDVGKIEHLGNLYFGPIDWSINRGDMETLFVADKVRIPIEDSSDPDSFSLVKEIKYLNNETAFRIIRVKK